jgi:hypothetical protein
MSNIKVRVGQQDAIKVSTSIATASKLSDLSDVDVSNKNDKYILSYNSSTNTFKLVNPDEVLVDAAKEPIQPGLPAGFLEEIINLEVDGGSY